MENGSQKKTQKKRVYKTEPPEQNKFGIKNPACYVMTTDNQRAHHVIKIEIYDLIKPRDRASTPDIQAQYTVCDPIDEIMDLAEAMVHKISKRIHTHDLFMMHN